MRTRHTLRVFARTAIRRVSYVLIGLGGAIARLRKRHSRPAAVRRILVCRLDLMGDLVFTRPLLLALRATYPDASITLLTLPYTAQLANLYEEVDRVVTVDTNLIRTPSGLLRGSTCTGYLQVLRTLRREHFDLGISVCGRMASLCVSLAGVRHSTGYAGEAYPFLLDAPLRGGRYAERQHEVEYVRDLAPAAGAGPAPHRLDVQAPEDAVRTVEDRLRACGVGPNDRLVVIHAGAVNGSAKRWPPNQWAHFADRLSSEQGVKLVLAGGASDESLASQVQAHATVPIPSLVGKTNVPELLALLARADLVASGDSGPLHLAVALGRPLVAAYGPTDPRVHGPYTPRAPVRIHRADIPCSPCYSMAATADCPLGDPICMRLVSVDQMVDSARELLGR